MEEDGGRAGGRVVDEEGGIEETDEDGDKEGEAREREEGERETLESLARGRERESDGRCSLGGWGTWMTLSL